MEHILRTQQFSREWLENDFFPLVKSLKSLSKTAFFLWKKPTLRDKEMITFFYEPSTRTRLSFELAMTRLGGRVVFSTENARQFSSAAKGEVIEDTIRVLCGYEPDVIVLRTDEAGMVERAVKYSTVPIINAGDGDDQHPTQALIDIFTIKNELGKIDNIVIAMCGDLNKGRTVRSLAYLCAKFSGVRIYFVSPLVAKMRDDVKDYLMEKGVPFEEVLDLREIASEVDVIYSTRAQGERGTILVRYGPPAFWKVNQEVLNLMKKEAIVMHPLPHLDEIVSAEVDQDPRAAYFRQAQNGLYVRMALLEMLLGEKKRNPTG